MKTALYQYYNNAWAIHKQSEGFDPAVASLVLGFGTRHVLQQPSLFNWLRERFPQAQIALCSTAGEICNTNVYDDSVSVAVMQFDGTPIATHAVKIGEEESIYEAGERLLQQFDKKDLSYLFILSDGSKVNGSELVNVLNDSLGPDILVTGGLAGDGSNFSSTLASLNATPEEGMIIGVGFYGDRIKINHGSKGGWEMFGLEKTVTRSIGNILYEMDHKSALDIYKKYLGAEAESLPGSALLFPLGLTLPDTGEQVVRTILSINQDEGSMIFAGDIPEGAQVRFMKANFDKITNAASDAAQQSLPADDGHPQLALLISCVGRKLILQSRTEEEVEAVDEVFDHKTMLAGFYSYGEISPAVNGGQCRLHNQTMTITTFYEAE
ncbi:FIST signal transduction protein [Chitinophagaceae bacterium MMS25-I14]